MFGTTTSKVAASVILVAASVGGTARLQAVTSQDMPREQPVTLDQTSLLVATLANGELQTQWMPRDVCEHIASAVVRGEGVAGVRADGVSVSITRANCSTRRVAADQTSSAFNVSERRE